jgi:hypothetical protein
MGCWICCPLHDLEGADIVPPTQQVFASCQCVNTSVLGISPKTLIFLYSFIWKATKLLAERIGSSSSLSLSLSLYIYIYMFNILFHNLAVFTIFRKFDNFLYEPDVKLMG